MVLLLDVVRGSSVLLVVLFHLRYLVMESAPILAAFSRYGYLGVAIFFVVSGYVITLSAESNLASGKSPLDFLRNRLRRVYPVYWVSILIVVAMPYMEASLSMLKSGNFDNSPTFFQRYTATDWLNLFFLTKVFQAHSPDLYAQFRDVNAVYWSLAIEVQFYIVMFLALYLRRYFRSFIALLSVVALALMYLPTNVNYGLFIHYWPIFAMGVGLAYMHRADLKFRPQRLWSAVAFPAFYLIALFLAYPLLPAHYNSLPLVVGIGAAGFLWFFDRLEGLLQKLKGSPHPLLRLSVRFMLLIGATSYSIYLLHLSVYRLPEMVLRQVLQPGGLLFAMLTLLATLALCYPLYFFVERHFMSKKYKQIHQQVLAKDRENS
jgi:peptidoglycan/LPS O-acetylase OafA/YrhL